MAGTSSSAMFSPASKKSMAPPPLTRSLTPTNSKITFLVWGSLSLTFTSPFYSGQYHTCFYSHPHTFPIIIKKLTKKGAKKSWKDFKDLKYLQNIKQFDNNDVENPQNFPKVKRVLITVILVLGAQQIWGIIMEANDSFIMFLPRAFFNDENVKCLKQFCSRRLPLFVHHFLYKALKLTFT